MTVLYAMLVCLFVFLMFYFARCIRWRFGLLSAPNMRTTVRSNVFALLACWRFCFCYLFLFNVLEVSTYCVCVLFSCSRGLNLSFLHRSFLSFVLTAEYKFALLTLSFKNFYIQSHCLPTFFLLFLLIGLIISFFFSLVWILREFSFF